MQVIRALSPSWAARWVRLLAAGFFIFACRPAHTDVASGGGEDGAGAPAVHHGSHGCPAHRGFASTRRVGSVEGPCGPCRHGGAAGAS